MKLSIALLFALCLSCLFSLAQLRDPYKERHLHGKVKTAFIRWVDGLDGDINHTYTFDETTRVVNTYDSNSALYGYIYNESGQLIELYTVGIRGDYSHKTIIEYTPRKRIEKTYDEQNNIYSTRIYALDYSGFVVEEKRYGGTGKLITQSKLKNDLNGKVIEELLNNMDGNVSVYKYEYDSRGNKTKDSHFSTTGKLLSITTSKYDRYNNEIERCCLLPTGEIYWLYRMQYYGIDANGNWTTAKRVNRDGQLRGSAVQKVTYF